MSYNLLNFPTGNLEGREDTLRHIINHVKPDLFLIQELKTDSGLQLILNESFADLSATYAASTFVPQQSNPVVDFKLQQAMVYNTELFGLAQEGYLMTATRDINKFKMFYRSPQLASGADTIFFYVHVAHFKSSQGTANQEERLSNVQTFTTSMAYLPGDASVILAGDFNMYRSTEPAYEELLNSSNYIRMRDPIDSPGSWYLNSFESKHIHTQSARVSSIISDGAGGGMDDRFDFILVSDNMMRPWNTIVYEADSYYAMGNTGTCYNQSITDCFGGHWSDDMLKSLYYMSDHLPVVMTLSFGVGNVGVEDYENIQPKIYWQDKQIKLNWNRNEEVVITVSDVTGRPIYSAPHTVNVGPNSFGIPEMASSKGMVIVRATSEHNQQSLKVVIE